MLKPEDLCTYPDPSPLYSRLVNHLDVLEENIYVTNGSDAALRMLFQAYVRPGKHVVFPSPTYAMYSVYAKMFRAQERTLAYDANLCLDIEQLHVLLQESPSVLVLANPDQPTGAVISQDELIRLAEDASQAGTLFIIDEAYHPFYPHTFVGLVNEFDNVVVTRTFSKAAGLAGMRLGYLVSNPDIVNNVRRVRGAHDVNAIAVAVGTYVLDHPEISEAYIEEVRSGRDVLAAAAHELGLGFPECPTNFQTLGLPGITNTAGIVAALREKGYLVKGNFTSRAVRNCIRVTLGPPDIMTAFASALEQVLVETAGEFSKEASPQ